MTQVYDGLCLANVAFFSFLFFFRLLGFGPGQLGIKHVISTDSIRHTLRSCTSEEECPVLYLSTYQADAASLPSSVLPPRPSPLSTTQQPGGSSTCSGEMKDIGGYIKQAAVVCGVTTPESARTTQFRCKSKTLL